MVMCPICAHSQQATIDARLLAGEPLLPLAREYALRSGELRWHRDAHVLHREQRGRRHRVGNT